MSMQQLPQTRRFTASEVAEYEYCSLVWWHEQFEPLAKADSEELFARLVELEHEYGPQATALPEYDMIEKLLLRRSAFDEGHQQHADHAEEVAEIEEEARVGASGGRYTRLLAIVIATLVILAVLLIVAAVLLR